MPIRLRRLRQHKTLRALVQETVLTPHDFILPLFVCPGKGIRKPISTMPGNWQMSIDETVKDCRILFDSGIQAVILFGIPETKDATATSGRHEHGIVQQAVREIKQAIPEMYIITDVCNCEYTDHGHCGILVDGDVDNDSTVQILAEQALTHARAGADMVAPSDMMDGRIGAIRSILDENGFTKVPIMSYAAKYASAFYGPFREAAESSPAFGDRSTYQMNPANSNEALREVEADVKEGADIVMVKPALAYLDIIRRVKDTFNMPVAAYNVSGEFSLVAAGVEKGWFDEERLTLEILTSIKRAGADIIISYHTRKIVPLLMNS